MTCILDDDEADIEAEIQRELEALGDDSLQIEDVEDNTSTSTVKTDHSQENALPDSIQEYLRLLQSRTEGAEEEVKECEIILEKLPSESLVKEDAALLSQRIKEELGEEYKENPLALRDQVFAELEETELREEREKLAKENTNEEDNQYALDIIRPGIIEEIQALEETARQQLKDLEEKQAEKSQKRDEWYQERRREEEARRAREKEARLQRQVQFEAAQKKLLQEQKALQSKLEAEAKEEEKKLQQIEEQFQVEIRALEEERKKQNEAFVETQRKEAEYQHQKKEVAATKLQKFYRGFRIRKQYQPLLEAKKLERIKRTNEELDRIERVERKLREEAEKKKLENEKKRKEENEKRRREEEERKKQEAAEKERKLKDEQQIREQEKRQTEEKKRIEEEKRKQEEVRRKREEEDKRREAEELQRKMEEEKRRVEEENRKREEERREKELEEKKKEEEERKRREEEEKQKEEQRRRKDEEKRMKEEKERLEIEKRRAEEDRKQKGKELQKREKSKIDAEMNTTQNKSSPPEQTETSVEQDESKTENNTEALEQKVGGLALTKDLEERRLQWIKEHTPWSTTSTVEERIHPVATKSRPRRVFSASKHLPILTEEQLLMSSPPNIPLFRVKYIALRDIPSCSMQNLSQCPDVRSLMLQHCGLLAVEGLDKCKELQELHVKDNKIEAINCKDLPKLETISLANNNLASIHGLEGCNSVVSLDLSNNKITRIGDLTPCSKLQQLFMDNNQLINSKGLSCLRNLQHLSLAHNHLARITEIENCMLLQTLNLQANNLQEPPHLVNTVLLRELKLDDNSIASMEPLSKAWLPLLQTLSVSQNSIFQLAPLGNFIMLETLDISNNLISDTDSLVPGLQGCNRLRTLKVEGNPVYEDPNCRALILEALPDLRNLDDEVMHVESKVTDKNQVLFIAMCQRQLQSQDALSARHEKEVSSVETQGRDPERVLTRLSLLSQHNQERFQLAVKHLLEHENFSPDSLHHVVKEERSRDVNTTEQKTTESRVNQDIEQRRRDSLDPLKERHVAATKIQALWRGWYIRHLIDVNTAKWFAAVTIQAAWRGYIVRSQLQRQPVEPWDPQRNSAATVIQAHFRGQRVRRRLNEALRAAQFYDDEGEEEFDYDEEVDLTAFDFDESALEQGWTPSETPQLPSRGPVLKLPGESSKTFLQKNSKTDYQRDVSNESTAPRPRHAWRSADSPITDVNQLPVGKATIDHDQTSMTSGVQSHVSHRAEELTNEWGFRSSETAELMMRRAKKMKYNPARRKKLLDPNKRLALFKKLEETNKLRDVKPPPTRRQPPNRVDYFAAREAMASHLGSTSPATEQHNREQMTYSWVYKQAVVHEDEEKNIMADRKEYSPDNRTKKTSPHKSNRSPVSLPHMDPAVLSGRTLPLISSPHFSQSLEQTSSAGPSPRRNSLSSARSSASGEQPIKTEKSNSAGARINRDSRNKR
ncbi:leucine-rich repeat and IQ domain-containing protein 1-like isoform X3 [Orbicella faveolata]|uniref:leucine-rich repeat and IQ domain-containing protein 1-like isoform X3 n=1 Tax=Orbicella faveolata TaxID=48498 RepID=UPI0009E30309|nr:leucine-rich repeat and IQ domain-containing protein 1-like isoform X3 [Orbicella faveolata]